MQSPLFWTLTLAFTAHAAALAAFIFHLCPLLLERGFEPSAIVVAMTLIEPAQVGGRIANTMLAGKAFMPRMGSFVVGFPLGFAALVFLPPSYALILVVTVLYGAANGILTIVRGAAVSEMLTRNNYGSVTGAMNTPATIARALAPVGAAALWSVSPSYDPVLLAILIGVNVLAFGFWPAAFLSKRQVPAAL